VYLLFDTVKYIVEYIVESGRKKEREERESGSI
jgi:hypothetical protein